MERQGFGIRFLAALIDWIILVIPSVILSLAFGYGFRIRFGVFADAQAALAFNLLMSVLQLLYWATEIFWAASPGKRILGLKIANEDATPATQEKLIMRWAIKQSPAILGLFVFILPGIIGGLFSFLVMGVSLAIFIGCFLTLGQQRQALHDMLAHTAVYKLAPQYQGFPVAPGAAGFPVTPQPGAPMPPPPPTA